MFNPHITPGDIVSNEQLYKEFQCANSGGMRRSKATDTDASRLPVRSSTQD